MSIHVHTSMASTALMSEEHDLGRECMTSLIFVSTTCMHIQPQSLHTTILKSASPMRAHRSCESSKSI